MPHNTARLTELLNYLPQAGITLFESARGVNCDYLRHFLAACRETQTAPGADISISPQNMHERGSIYAEHAAVLQEDPSIFISLFRGDGHCFDVQLKKGNGTFQYEIYDPRVTPKFPMRDLVPFTYNVSKHLFVPGAA